MLRGVSGAVLFDLGIAKCTWTQKCRSDVHMEFVSANHTRFERIPVFVFNQSVNVCF